MYVSSYPHPMARNTKEKAQETRERILDAAEDVFLNKGVSATSLNDVALAAGVTRGAIYWHFKNKVDLFDAMCGRVRYGIKAMVDEVADEKTSDPLGLLRTRGKLIRRTIVEDPHYRKVMTIIYHRCEFTDANDPILVNHRNWTLYNRELTQRILSNAQAKNQLPPDLDLHLASVMLHAIYEGLINSWLLTPADFDLVEDASHIIDAAHEILRTNPALRIKAGTGKTGL